jgi:hypothetical protein
VTPVDFPEFVAMDGLSAVVAAMDAMTREELADALLARVMERRERLERRRASSATEARGAFLAWANR